MILAIGSVSRKIYYEMVETLTLMREIKINYVLLFVVEMTTGGTGEGVEKKLTFCAGLSDIPEVIKCANIGLILPLEKVYRIIPALLKCTGAEFPLVGSDVQRYKRIVKIQQNKI